MYKYRFSYFRRVILNTDCPSIIMITRYRGVDITPHTVNNLIKTIASHGSKPYGNDAHLQDIIFAYDPSLKKLSHLSITNLLILALKNNNVKETTYNYNYRDNSSIINTDKTVDNLTPTSVARQLNRIISDGWDYNVIADVIKDFSRRFDDGDDAIMLMNSVRQQYDKYVNKLHEDTFRTVWRLDTTDYVRFVTQLRECLLRLFNNEPFDTDVQCIEYLNRVIQNKYAELDSVKNAYDTQLQNIETNMTQIKVQLQHTNTTLEDERAKCAKLIYENNELKEHVEQLNDALNAAVDENATLKCDNETFRDTLDKFEKERQDELDKMHTTFANFESRFSGHTDEEYEQVELKNEQLQNEIVLLKEQINTLKQQAYSVSKQLYDKTHESQLHQASYLDKCQELIQIKEEHQMDLEAIKNEHNVTYKDLIHQLTLASDANTKSYNEYFSNIQENNEQHKKNIEHLQSKIKQLTDKIVNINDQHEKALDETEHTLLLREGKMAALENEIVQLKKEIDALQDTVKKIDNDNKECEREKTHLQAELDETLNQLARTPLKRKNDSPTPTTTKKKQNELNWNLNKLYKIKDEDDLKKIIQDLKEKNKHKKDWELYDKFLTCSTADIKLNPGYHSLDANFKKLLDRKEEIEKSNTLVKINRR
ncbi:PxORF94 peptide [Plutella xylostella granulovirus]|uniref:PxORF94 peptide n=1 Tax=Plutella xylostella granulovirus TaxID=98383 RepID=Q9DVT9_9BBAC|nr:PxORF94 peptide [Plutella xylostella granulovirus]AAG27392.1 PxORF94 peptide [Plutella xylostella granulovirus]